MDNSTAEFESLDPKDWEAARAVAHQMIDFGLEHMRDVRDRPVWQDMPDDVRGAFEGPVPQNPENMDEILGDVTDKLFAYPMGNIHPRFWAWYMGSSNLTGALADFLAAVQGSNLGGGNHAAALIDAQVVDWLREMIGLPKGASGTLVSGGSVANLVGLTVARNHHAGCDLREVGVAGMTKPMRFYGSDQIHSCHQTAIEVLGLGNQALVRLPSNADLTLDLMALRDRVTLDRAAGFNPACVIATAGTVNTGAIDDLAAIADFCEAEDMWFHVDGCIGALIAIAPENGWRVAGIERANSVALDPHKWLHAPFDVGCALVRDREAHLETFAVAAEYLKPKERGLAAAQYLHDFGIQTSRGFRALKVWMALREHGVQKFGRMIDQDFAKAAYLSKLVERTTGLNLLFPTNINIVCFRYDPGGLNEDALKELNIEIMLQLQEQGIAVLSDTTVNGRHCLRAAINNHRTRPEDLSLMVAELMRIAANINPLT